MKQLFNSTSMKFVSGFVGMVMLGLAGILIASYFEGESQVAAEGELGEAALGMEES